MSVRNFNSQNIPLPLIKTPQPILTSSPQDCWELEIGCGDGEFSFNRALQNLNKNIIAIEKTRNKIRRLWLRKNPPKNLWILHTNAVWWVNHFVPMLSLDKIFIFYPNIYKKQKQVNLRWINRPFTPFLIERLKNNGCIEFRTNELFYHQETKEKMTQRLPFMECVEDRKIPRTHHSETTFERKYLARMDCFALKFLKRPY